MSVPIHPTAIVHPGAELEAGVELGPFAIVESGVHVGAGTRVMAYAYLCQGTRLGARCEVHMGAVVGHAPQDFAYRGQATGLTIGDGVIIRENVTLHRATGQPGAQTVIGDGCYLMAGSHVAHN